MSNHLKGQASPYLLQHAENPVDWYPWCQEAFHKARTEDKPIFLSIGYSTCHWCHVMARESFEDRAVAELLNRYFISIKVDREERPDIDSIYMSVCQALTGSGGWPMSIFMTPTQKPFFAGTYFPKDSRYGILGFQDLLCVIHEKWETDRETLLKSAEEIIRQLQKNTPIRGKTDKSLIDSAVNFLGQSYDAQYGGFGDAPKFPTPHLLLFLLTYAQKSREPSPLKMAETTLQKMYRGGLFDHIGYGFYRYSTDKYFRIPHFEKMLYDNALLILAYCRAYAVTKNPFYRDVAEKTAAYILREMTAPNGGFYSAQDADSHGVEGGYYTLEPSEITAILGEKTGGAFNRYYDITKKGNFNGKNLPNLLKTDTINGRFDSCLPAVYKYRKERSLLYLDDKILTSWNSLMIGAMCHLYRISTHAAYLEAAKKAQYLIESKLCKNGTLYTSIRNNRRGEKGFLDDYAFYAFALLALYEATLNPSFLRKAQQICEKAVADFFDESQGGFFLCGKDSESLIFRPKETYDGALPSGNSMMAYTLVWLCLLTDDNPLEDLKNRQLSFLSGTARQFPAGYSMFLTALSDELDAPEKITVVGGNPEELTALPCQISPGTAAMISKNPSAEYPLKNGKPTFYICHHHTCFPPTNHLEFPKFFG